MRSEEYKYVTTRFFENDIYTFSMKVSDLLYKPMLNYISEYSGANWPPLRSSATTLCILVICVLSLSGTHTIENLELMAKNRQKSPNFLDKTLFNAFLGGIWRVWYLTFINLLVRDEWVLNRIKSSYLVLGAKKGLFLNI